MRNSIIEKKTWHKAESKKKVRGVVRESKSARKRAEKAFIAEALKDRDE